MLARRMIEFPSMGGATLCRNGPMARRMDWLTSGSLKFPRLPLRASRTFPAVSISEDRDHFYVCAELPGIIAEDLKLEVIGDRLVISGERSIPSRSDNARYHLRERVTGRFCRILRLPGEVDASSVDAKLADGMLTVTIAKSDAAKPRKISVKSS